VLGQVYPLTRETVLIGLMLAVALVTRLWVVDVGNNRLAGFAALQP